MCNCYVIKRLLEPFIVEEGFQDLATVVKKIALAITIVSIKLYLFLLF